jgi:hypothetical protein
VKISKELSVLSRIAEGMVHGIIWTKPSVSMVKQVFTVLVKYVDGKRALAKHNSLRNNFDAASTSLLWSFGI